MMEEIGLKMPRFDECISLLRTEIDELKAGKHDHRLREVVANPLDPRLHAVLAKDVDGGLELPLPPRLSDSEDDGDENTSNGGHADDESVHGGVSDLGAADAADGRKEKGERKQQEVEEAELQVVDVEKKERLAPSVGNGGKKGSEKVTSEDEKPEELAGSTTPCTNQETRAAAQADATPTRQSSKGNGTPLPAAPTNKKGGASGPDDPGGGDGENAVAAGPPTPNRSKRDLRTHASPLRDRPPVLSGGGSRVAPAPPAPDPNITTPSPTTPSSNHHARRGSGGKPVGESSGKGERRGRDRGNGSGTGSAAAAAAAAIAAVATEVTQGKSGGDGGTPNKQEEDGLGGTGGDSAVAAAAGGGRSGRKRPRAGGSGAMDKARDRRPPSERRDKPDHTEVDSESVKEDQSETSSEGDHFRRIALEVWDRVNKHKFAIIFRKAVNPKDAPGYEKVIKKPMDLSLIRERIMSGALASLDDMSRDLFVMCNNAMVFNGVGDPYFDYSKELRTYASSVIEEARRPGFVTADPGFDSVVAGSRTSRRPPELTPAVRHTPRSARGKGRKRRGGGGGSSRSRDSDSASVADDTGDEGAKGRRGSGGSRGSGGGNSIDGDTNERKRGAGLGRKKKTKKGGGGKKGGKNHAPSDDGGSLDVGASTAGDSSGEEAGEEQEEEEEQEEDASQSASTSEGGGAGEKRGKKHGAGTKRKKRARAVVSDDSSDEEPSITRGKGRKALKPTAKSKARSKKRR